MIGKTILHYIKSSKKLGEGGMGVVYKVEDTKLERIVGLKFLSLISISDEEKKRFKREAKAAASLNHCEQCEKPCSTKSLYTEGEGPRPSAECDPASKPR